MAGTAVQRRLSWQLAEVVDVTDETPKVRSIELRCPEWQGHLPGQHVDVRLTADDGYQAQRSYSIATAAAGDRITITVELVDDGEVSPYLVGELRTGDMLELRGPIGGYFVWEPSVGGPLQLIAGGSGIVPLMAMLRARVEAESDASVRMLVSARTLDAVIYRSELATIAEEDGIEVVHTLTRSQPPGWTGPSRRVDRAMLEELSWPAGEVPLCYVCGPTGFVETVASVLVDLGHAADRIKTERFGPSGGTS
jgi:ferredoxin-NADP reductase